MNKREIIKKIPVKKNWPIRLEEGDKIYFIEKTEENFVEENNDALVNRIKVFIKKYPKVFFVIFRLVGLSFLGKSPQRALKDLGQGSMILNLGAGVSVIRQDVINVDSYPFENVDIVADIADLPFEDVCADALISEHVLEHISDPEKAINEMLRILKPGGLVYITVPFVMGFHSSPNDYYRWSDFGLERQFKDFEKIESGVRSGPGAAVNYILAEYIATLLSFGWVKLQQILFVFFMLLFAPFCWLDYLIGRFPTSKNIAHCVYYIGRKK